MTLFLNRKTLSALIVLLGFLALPLSAEAGLLSKLAREGAEAAGSAAKKFDAPIPKLEDGIWFAKKLPAKAGAANMALLPGENGTWRLITEAGDEVPLSSLDEMAGAADGAATQVVKGLAGDAPKITKLKNTQIAIREADFFKLRDQIGDIPKSLDLQIVRNSGKTLPLKQVRAGDKSRLMVELDKDVLLNPKNLRAMDANLKFLDTPVKQADLKIARFDSTAKAKQQAARQTLNDPTSILDPNLLESSLAKYKNRTLMLGGKVTTDPATGAKVLQVKDGGKIVNLDLATLDASAARQRVNLMLVDTGTPTQPGKSLFSKTSLEKRFATAQTAFTQADLMKAVTPPNAKTIINAAEDGKTRITMTTRHFDADPAAAAAAAADDYTLAGWLLEGGARVAARQVTYFAEDPDHTEEMNGRWLPWFKNMDLIVYSVFAVVFVFTATKTWGWWKALWRMVARKSREDEDFPKGVRIARMITFAPFSMVMFFPALVWIGVVSQLSFLAWPFRKLFGKANPGAA
ncbi:hypothetical protein [Roseibium sediminis]|uniref:hypothetical protein n=1 Tax=Roseibium sediminis TaxID=1775174 RepID=UPI001375C5E8|nr:hypothetical protein [Roseibium sediminis]